VLGDIDGVVVIPRDAASSVIEEAAEKATAENLVREALRNGLSVTDAWSKYGVM
jgi:regulator of RNase E activity RraA